MSTFHFVNPATLSKPQPGLAINIVKNWWLTDKDGRIAFFVTRGSSKYSSPQCNSRESIIRAMAADHMNKGDGLFSWVMGIVQLPLVSVPARASDYVS